MLSSRPDGDSASRRGGGRLATGAVAWLALSAWLLGTAGAFWFVEIRGAQPLSAQGAQVFESRDVAGINMWFRTHVAVGTNESARATATLVHLYNPDCRCNVDTERHLQRLIDRYQSRGVRFVTALAPSYANRAMAAPLGIPVVDASDRSLVRAGIDMAAAALIFDARGRLIYYGPYSAFAGCGSAGGRVEPILDRALDGRAPAPAGALTVVRGCFCAW